MTFYFRKFLKCRNKTFRVLLISFFLISLSLNAQKAINKTISVLSEGKQLSTILFDIHKKYNIDFYFEPESLPVYALNARFQDQQVFKILSKLTDATNLLTLPYGQKGVLVIHRNKADQTHIQELVKKWEKGTLKYPEEENLEKENYLFGTRNDHSDVVNLSIEIVEKNSQFPLVGASIYEKTTGVFLLSDDTGTASLSLKNGSYNITIELIGYKTKEIDLEIYKNAKLSIEMSLQNVVLNTIEFTVNQSRDKLLNNAGNEVVSIEKISAIPQALGEVDIIKSLEILPGVTTAGDISSGINVRGGNIDESMVLFNDGIIFNPTHIVGFISAFNADAIDQASLYKGYLDAQYGGRSAAVLDIESTARDVSHFKGKGGIGTSLVKLFVEGRASSRLSYHFSGRASFNDYLLGLIANSELQNSNARFGDINSSLYYDFSSGHSIQAENYWSSDVFEYNNEFGYSWSNFHTRLKWNSKWTDKLFSNISLNLGSYKSNQFTLTNPSSFNFYSGIDYHKILSKISYEISEKGYVQLGSEYIKYIPENDELIPRASSTLTQESITRKGNLSIAQFITMNYFLTNNIKFEGSLRYVNYMSSGQGRIYTYTDNNPSEDNIIDSRESTGIDEEGTHSFWEPRLSLGAKINDKWSINIAYNKLSQNAFQMSTGNTALPSDMWLFSGRYISPQVVDQYSITSRQEFNNLDLSIGAFYKNFKNVNILKNFADIILNDHIETELVNGKGYSYGFEFLSEGNLGKWDGTMAYTFSRTFRKTQSDKNAINNNEWFPADFDIPHQLNLLLVYKMLPVSTLNILYIYKSGKPVSAPEAALIQSNYVVPLYAERNQHRIPAYSRLDLSITLDLRKTKSSGFRSSFTFGLYNFLGRNNAYSVYFRRSEKGNIQPFRFSVVGSVVPNISWNFEF